MSSNLFPLTQMGELIFGTTRWKAAVAREMGVDVRTVNRWAQGIYFNEERQKQFLKMARRRHREIGDFISRENAKLTLAQMNARTKRA